MIDSEFVSDHYGLFRLEGDIDQIIVGEKVLTHNALDHSPNPAIVDVTHKPSLSPFWIKGRLRLNWFYLRERPLFLGHLFGNFHLLLCSLLGFFRGESDWVPWIDPVRIGDVGVPLPEPRPLVRILQKSIRDIPQCVAFLNGINTLLFLRLLRRNEKRKTD